MTEITIESDFVTVIIDFKPLFTKNIDSFNFYLYNYLLFANS